ncbi:MAG: hypothetical protein F4020_10705 [Gammaproteobacteria bacterium]|nr:hypothetical protein [Acidimicrobiaceae bacterium]MYK69939.1 hypothetical protein [Gammaproteobacteria bacterium]
MIKVTLPPPEVAPLRRLDPPPLEEWAHTAWEWQAMWARFSLASLMRLTPAGTATTDHVCAHFNQVGDRCWEMWSQIKHHQTSALPTALSGPQRHRVDREIDKQAALAVASEWIQIPKEVAYPAWDPHLDCEMFETAGLEYLGRTELADAVIWATANATDLNQQTPALLTVEGLQHSLDHRLTRAERHLVFSDAAQWARREAARAGRAPERLQALLRYPVPVY